MDTLIHSNSENISAHAEKAKSSSYLSHLIDELEATRFAFAPMILVVMACLGGIAAGFAVKQGEAQLMAVAISASFVEVLVIALAPMRMVVIATAIALLVDLFVFIF